MFASSRRRTITTSFDDRVMITDIDVTTTDTKDDDDLDSPGDSDIPVAFGYSGVSLRIAYPFSN